MNNMQLVNTTVANLNKLCNQQFCIQSKVERINAIRKLLPNAFEHGPVKAMVFGDPSKPFTYVLVLTLANNEKHEFKLFNDFEAVVPMYFISNKYLGQLKEYSPIWFNKYCGFNVKPKSE